MMEMCISKCLFRSEHRVNSDGTCYSFSLRRLHICLIRHQYFCLVLTFNPYEAYMKGILEWIACRIWNVVGDRKSIDLIIVLNLTRRNFEIQKYSSKEL